MENDEVGHRVCHVAATDPDGDKLWYYIFGELLTVATHFTHTHPFNGPFSGTTWVSQYQKGKTNLDFIGARGSE